MEMIMSPCENPWFMRPALPGGVTSFLGAVALGVLLAPCAQAQDAAKILKAMSDYVTAEKNISLSYDADIEVVTSELQKIQFASSGQVLLGRPDKVRITRTGGYADVDLVFDGKTVTLLGKNLNAFAQADAPGTVDQLVDGIRDQYNIQMPGADLLLSRVYDELTSDVMDAKHRAGGDRRRHMRAPRVPRSGGGLAAVGRDRRQADSPQIHHHQQARGRRPAIHAARQGLEDRRGGRRRRVHVQAAGRRQAGGIRCPAGR